MSQSSSDRWKRLFATSSSTAVQLMEIMLLSEYLSSTQPVSMLNSQESKTPEARDYRRRNGAVYLMKNGEFGRGPFTLETRKEMLRRLLQLQKSSGFELISEEELKFIDKVWEQEGDLTCRAVVDIYFEVMGERLPWDQYKKAKYLCLPRLLHFALRPFPPPDRGKRDIDCLLMLAALIAALMLCIYRLTTGFSTIVSDVTIYTFFLRSSGASDSSISKVSWQRSVESLPPL